MATSKEWKWGYISHDGEFAITPAFDEAKDFHEERAVVRIDWARGYIDTKGEFVVAPRFEKADPFYQGIARVVEDGVTRYIDRSGNYVDPPADYAEPPYPPFTPDEKLLTIYFDAGSFSEHLAPVKKSASGKWGYINEDGKYAIRPAFRQAFDFHDGLARVLTQI